MLDKITSKLLIVFGTILVAIGLELFLVPNKIIDGGVIGISIILNYITNYQLGILIFCLNFPFLLFGLKKLGHKFILNSLFSVTSLSVFTMLVDHIKEDFHVQYATHELFLATIFGGIITGVGVGIVLKNNGSLDGTEVLAVAFTKKLGFSVGEIVMFFNIFILGSSGFVLGWDRAMYSIATYYIISKAIDFILEGMDDTKSVMIISDKYEVISNTLMTELDKGVTFIQAQGGYTKDPKKVIYCVISRLELSQLREIVIGIDKEAFVTVQNIHEVRGGRIKKINK